MKAKLEKVRTQPSEELINRILEIKESLFRLNFKKALGDTDTVKNIRKERKELARLKTDGKIREFGIAVDAAEHAQDCLALEGVSSLQLPFGLLDLEALDGVLQALSDRQFGVIARGCFAGGALKESLSEADLRATEPKWERVLLLRRLFERFSRASLEAALQFSLRFREISTNLLGMRTPQHLVSNLKYYSSRPLSDEEFQELLAHIGRSMPA